MAASADAQVKEWARNGSFMKKPATGWLHKDADLSNGDGVYYPVKYIGKVMMTMSMRTLRFEDRTAVTREAITMACEAAGARPPRKRKVPKVAKDCLANEAKVMNLNVKLTVSTTGIALVVIGTNQVIANHIMPCISFATGGDATDYDVIGYVAKDSRNMREVHIFDCGHMAHDVMATVGQAFELRFKAFLRKQQTGSSMPGAPPKRGLPSGAVEDTYDQANGGLYDDLPGGGGAGYEGEFEENPYGDAGGDAGGYDDVGSQGYHNESPHVRGPPEVYGDDGMYDKGDAKSMASGYVQGRALSAGPLYDNRGPSTGDGLSFGSPTYDTASAAKDYDEALYGELPEGALPMRAPGGGELEKPLRMEKWFHGPLRREAADAMLRKNGDFLVRENIGAPGQFVLSTMQGGRSVHLLLVDPAGRVQTKDMAFNSVSHLINYHLRARIPVVAGGARLTLGEPVANMVGSNSDVYG